MAQYPPKHIYSHGIGGGGHESRASVAKSGFKDLSSSPEVRQGHHAEAFFAVGGAGMCRHRRLWVA